MKTLPIFLLVVFPSLLFAQSSAGCAAAGVPLTLPDNDTLTVPIEVSGLTNNDTLGVNGQRLLGVRLHWTHPFVGDLVAELEAPDGSSVTLLNTLVGLSVGVTTGTVWDVVFVPCAEAATPDPGFDTVWINDQSWGSNGLFTGTYHPFAGCLEDLTGSANGTWKLRLIDLVPVDFGELLGAQLLFADPAGLDCDPAVPAVMAAFADSLAGDTVFFHNLSANADLYAWSFGDGSTSTAVDPVHVYLGPGSYTVQLIAVNGPLRDTAVQTVIIPDNTPAALFSVSAPAPCAGAPITFVNASTGPALSFQWSFPGGIPATSTDESPTVVYAESGQFTATLIATNAYGADTMVSAPLTIYAIEPPLATVETLPGVQSIAFAVAYDTLVPGAFLWSFGDGQESTAAAGVHAYAQPGTYTVSWIWQTVCGAASGDTTITVEAAATGVNGCQPFGLPMPLTDLGTLTLPIGVAGLTSDSLGVNGQRVCGVRLAWHHEYQGDMSAVLVAPDGSQVTLIGPAGFFGPTDGTLWDVVFLPCTGLQLPPSAGTPDVWTNEWPWGQNSFYSGTFWPAQGCLEDLTGPANGIWEVRFTDHQAADTGAVLVAQLYFCDSTGLACIEIEPDVQAAFTAAVAGFDVSFTNLSQEALTYAWSFGDGATSTAVNPIHTYPDTGTYLVRLIAINGSVRDTFEQAIYVPGQPPVAQIVAPTAICYYETAHFQYPAAGQPGTVEWSFPGGTPSSSTLPAPQISYDSAGSYTATLIVTNALGADTATHTITVYGFTSPVITLTPVPDSDSLLYSAVYDTATPGSMIWSFGDGSPVASGPSGVHIYAAAGEYTVYWTLQTICGTANGTQQVIVGNSGVAAPAAPGFSLVLLPNPVRDRLTVVLKSGAPGSGRFALVDGLGRTVRSWDMQWSVGENRHTIRTDVLSPGVYWLVVPEWIGMAGRRVVKVE